MIISSITISIFFLFTSYTSMASLPLLAVRQKLGSHLGKQGAAADYVAGLLRCGDVVDEHYDELSDEFKKIAKGYVAGINAYAAKNPRDVLIKDIFPITVRDYLSVWVLQLTMIPFSDMPSQCQRADQVGAAFSP